MNHTCPGHRRYRGPGQAPGRRPVLPSASGRPPTRSLLPLSRHRLLAPCNTNRYCTGHRWRRRAREIELAGACLPQVPLVLHRQRASNFGTWLQNTAQVVLAYQLTRSVFAVGLVTCAQFSGPLLLGPWAAVLTHRFGNWRALIITQCASMVVAATLATLEFGHWLTVRAAVRRCGGHRAGFHVRPSCTVGDRGCPRPSERDQASTGPGLGVIQPRPRASPGSQRCYVRHRRLRLGLRAERRFVPFLHRSVLWRQRPRRRTARAGSGARLERLPHRLGPSRGS